MKILIIFLATITFSFTLVGCSLENDSKPSKRDTSDKDTGKEVNDNSSDDGSNNPALEEETAILEKINAKEAKEIMDGSEDYILLDVRTDEEFNSGHIEGAILLPDYEIEEKAAEVLEDKSTTLLIYCRSGRRSALAAQVLSDLGYTRVYDFGGIIDWPYDIVTE